jgi:erythronate-4-phosphate dehydrogenase
LSFDFLMKIVADENIPFAERCFSSMGQVKVVPSRQITSSVVRDADILLVRSVTPVDSKLLADSSVRFVGTSTIGFEHIDINFLSRNNIGFASAPGANANSAAEYVIAALLELGRRNSIDLQGKSIGIVGAGNVGSRVAAKAAALGMKVLLNDPPLQRRTGDAKYLPLTELFDCDFVTLHTPLTFEGVDKTFHLADERFFKSLKKGCVFLNTSRGGVVNSDALKNAVRTGRLSSLVLDVWENEPNINTELLAMADIATPHIAGYSLDGRVAGMIMIYRAACEHFGLEVEFGAESFLPAPETAQVKINSNSGSEQDILHEMVRKIYDIKRDDSDLRWILDRPAGKRAAFFDDLRKNYPARREFSNTQLVLQPRSETLAKKFAGIGFKVLTDG